MRNAVSPRLPVAPSPRLFAVLALVVSALACGGEGARLQVGEFTATRFEKPPVIDGVASEGEWDRAFTTSGLIAPFEHEMHETVTVMSLGFDDQNLYFLMRCKRGNYEWKLWKFCRQNDDYNFGEPSVEIWVTPPALVPETYQSIINTYPAVMDAKMIPTRGYTGMGWKGGWKIGVKESDTEYVIEASVPIKDFGHETIKNGDVWQFLLGRTCHGAKPRSQASWSITQGFSEIPGHPKVHMMDDESVVQLTGTHTIFTGKYEFPIGVVAPRKAAADIDVELRFHKEKAFSDADQIEKKHVALKAGERQVITFAGDVTAMKKGNFTITATRAHTAGGDAGATIFRESFPFAVTGWTPQAPVKPEKAPSVEELAINAQYGPETNTILVKADIIDLPTRKEAAAAEVQVVDAETQKVLASSKMRPFLEWYAGAEVRLQGIDIPVDDFRKVADLRAQIRQIQAANELKKKKNEKPDPLPQVPHPAAKKVNVVVSVKDKDGKELKSASKPVELLRYAAEWMNNSVGISEKVIPPWTPLRTSPPAPPLQGEGRKDACEIGVWNRTLSVDGLGLAKSIKNGGVEQLASMRLVAVQDGKEIEFKADAPEVKRAVEAEADLTGAAEAAGLRLSAKTRVEFDGFVKVELSFAPASPLPLAPLPPARRPAPPGEGDRRAGRDAGATRSTKLDKLFLEIVLPEAEATHFCTTAGGWTAVHDVLPDRWTSQSTASGMLVGDFVPYIWLTNSDRAFLWFADHDIGWNHEPDKALPTQEIVRKDGKVTLRVNFFEIPTEVKEPRTITWGWQTFPSRPLPKGWRATFCAQSNPVPHTTNTYFWADADWAVLWPYYCSPFPWSMEKSKAFLDNAKKRGPTFRPCVGSIAHSIGRFQDYDGNPFNGLLVDWALSPGINNNADVTASKGPNDFRLWHYQKWVREAGFCGLYVDENYLGLEENFLTGNAWWRPDGRLQRAYNYLGLREYFKRIKVMFHENGATAPNLWQHVSGGAAYHSWFGDIFYEGENVEPTDLNFDYIEVLPAGRMRAIGSSVCAGGVMTMMCQSDRHRTQWHQKHTHQFVGWVLAHDILPEQVPLYPKLCEAGHLWEDDVRFLPYWKPSPFGTKQEGCLVSAHATKDRALLWVVNTSRKDADVSVSIDWKAAGLDPAKVSATNPETGEAVPLTSTGFSVPVLQRDFVPVLIEAK
ncbi:MAG TPA: glycoside hydrolase domain-containing protein [Planctomycetota bacterium]|jgi:hypothetical protein